MKKKKVHFHWTFLIRLHLLHSEYFLTVAFCYPFGWWFFTLILCFCPSTQKLFYFKGTTTIYSNLRNGHLCFHPNLQSIWRKIGEMFRKFTKIWMKSKKQTMRFKVIMKQINKGKVSTQISDRFLESLKVYIRKQLNLDVNEANEENKFTIGLFHHLWLISFLFLFIFFFILSFLFSFSFFKA